MLKFESGSVLKCFVSPEIVSSIVAHIWRVTALKTPMPSPVFVLPDNFDALMRAAS